MIVPNVFQQHRSRHNLSRMLHEVFKQTKFAGLQSDILTIARASPGQQIKFQIANNQAWFAPLQAWYAGPALRRGPRVRKTRKAWPE